MSRGAPPDPWDDVQLAVERRAARRDLEISRLRLLSAMASCGMPAPATASLDELLKIIDWRNAERLRRLAK